MKTDKTRAAYVINSVSVCANASVWGIFALISQTLNPASRVKA